MKKIIFFGLLAMSLVLSPMAEASLTTTLDFWGYAKYSQKGKLKFPKKFVPHLNGTLTKNNSLRHVVNAHKPYRGIAAVAYGIDWNLPDWDTPYTWTVDVDVWAKGTTGHPPVLTWSYTKTFPDLGPVSLRDLSGGYSKAQVKNYLETHIPSSYYWPGKGGYLIDGDWNSGAAYGFVKKIPNDFPYDLPPYLKLNYGGTIALTAQEAGEPVIPEPASVMLLGMGLLGIAGMKRKMA